MIYRYDGSFPGFLCCVFESYRRREVPEDIRPESAEQASLFPERRIETDPAHAERVFVSLGEKIDRQAQYLVRRGFLNGEPDKEMVLYRFIRLGLQQGPRTVRMLGEETVSRLRDMVRAVGNESEQLKGFLRFSEYRTPEGKPVGLAAVIEPKHHVLPVMKAHFVGRYPNEPFLIYDKTHGELLLYRPHEARLLTVEEFELPPADENERQYRRLWKHYYDTVGIEERENLRRRQSHLPKRFWAQVTELQEQTFPTYGSLSASDRQELPAGQEPTALPSSGSKP